MQTSLNVKEERIKQFFNDNKVKEYINLLKFQIDILKRAFVILDLEDCNYEVDIHSSYIHADIKLEDVDNIKASKLIKFYDELIGLDGNIDINFIDGKSEFEDYDGFLDYESYNISVYNDDNNFEELSNYFYKEYEILLKELLKYYVIKDYEYRSLNFRLIRLEFDGAELKDINMDYGFGGIEKIGSKYKFKDINGYDVLDKVFLNIEHCLLSKYWNKEFKFVEDLTLTQLDRLDLKEDKNNLYKILDNLKEEIKSYVLELKTIERLNKIKLDKKLVITDETIKLVVEGYVFNLNSLIFNKFLSLPNKYLSLEVNLKEVAGISEFKGKTKEVINSEIKNDIVKSLCELIYLNLEIDDLNYIAIGLNKDIDLNDLLKHEYSANYMLLSDGEINIVISLDRYKDFKTKELVKYYNQLKGLLLL